MVPDGDTKFASRTALGDDEADAGEDEVDVGDEAADGSGEKAPVGGDEAAADGASPSPAFVPAAGRVGREFGVPPEAEHAARAAASMIAPHNPAHPRAGAMSPPKAE